MRSNDSPRARAAVSAAVIAGVLLALGPLVASSNDTPFQAVPVPSEDAARLEVLRDRVAAAYGGAPACRAVRGFHARGEILSVADGLAGRIEVSVLFDGSMRSEVHFAPRSDIELLAGSLAWTGGRRRLTPASSDARDAIRLQYHRLAAPFAWIADTTGAWTLAPGEEPGRERVIRRWGERLTMTLEVDATSGLVYRTIGSVGEGSPVVTTDFSDHRAVEGPAGAVMLAHRITVRVDDRFVSEIVLDRIEERGEFPNETFLPPGASGDF